MIIPSKRKRTRMGVDKGPKWEWPKHEKFIRSLQCCVVGCPDKSVFAHQRTAANSGTSIKPPSWFGVPLCDTHHKEQHAAIKTFERKYGLDLLKIARVLALSSPDLEMREAMRSMDHPEHADREAVTA